MIHKLVGAGGVVIAGVIITVSGFDDPRLISEKYTTAINTFRGFTLSGFLFTALLTLLITSAFDQPREPHGKRIRP